MSTFAKSSAFSWPVALPAALLVHVAVLSLNLGTSAALNDGDAQDMLRIAVVDGELEPVEIVRTGAADVHADNARDFAARLEGLPREAPPGERARRGALDAARAAVEVLELELPAAQQGARVLPDGGEVAADRPLDAQPLPPGGGAPASGVTAGDGVAGVTGQGVASNGSGGEGGTAKRRGGTDLFSRVADRMIAEQQRAPFALNGQPAFPRACRQGLCRRGAACEGASEWRVTVSAAGGAPTKIEAVREMDCELQNASIRKFFNEYKFPSGDRARIFVFPVEMRISR